MTCWVVTSGEAGIASQALGLADAMGLTQPAVKKVTLRWPWAWAPNCAALASLAAAGRNGDQLQPPWPDVLISCGRKGAFLSMAVKKASQGKTSIVHIQDPRGSRRAYDAVVVPAHDRMRGDNVIVSRGALHRVSAARLKTEADAWRGAVSRLPRPLVAVLVGGNNRYYRMDGAWGRLFGAQLAAMARASGCGLMVTGSRRTPPEAMAEIVRAMDDVPAMIWDGQGANPYMGYLGLADAVIASCDSVSMISEALSTGKPVMLARVPGKGRRFEIFFAALERDGFIRWFGGALEMWPNKPLDDMKAIADQVWKRLEVAG
jgi:uncharacterized protein